MGAPLPAQHGASAGLWPQARHAAVSAFGPAAMRPQPGEGVGKKTPTTLLAGSLRLPGTGAADSGDQPNYRSRVTGRATRHTEDAEAGGSLRQA